MGGGLNAQKPNNFLCGSVWIATSFISRLIPINVLKGEKNSKQHCENQLEQKNLNGNAGIWTQDFPHAKQTLYHWVTSPAEEHWESDTFEDHIS